MSKRYSGVRAIIPGQKYEIFWQLDGYKSQHRICAGSEREASLMRSIEMAEHSRKLAIPKNEKDRLSATFEEIWSRLEGNIRSDGVTEGTLARYKNSYDRLFGDFRERYYPKLTSPGQLYYNFFERYKEFYALELNRKSGLRTEITHVTSLVRRLRKLGYVPRGLVEELEDITKPNKTEKEYPNIPASKIKELLAYAKKDRPDYYRVIYHVFRTGRRIRETSLIEGQDVILRGLKPIGLKIRVKTTKTKGKAPINYLDEGLERNVREALNNNKSKWLYANKRGNRCHPNRVRDYLKKISKEIIGVSITPHYFRHRICTEAPKKGVSIPNLKALTGIRDNRVLLEHYSHEDTDGIQRALKITEG